MPQPHLTLDRGSWGILARRASPPGVILGRSSTVYAVQPAFKACRRAVVHDAGQTLPHGLAFAVDPGNHGMGSELLEPILDGSAFLPHYRLGLTQPIQRAGSVFEQCQTRGVGNFVQPVLSHGFAIQPCRF